MTIVHNSRPTKIHWRAAHGQDHGQLIDKCGKIIAQWRLQTLINNLPTVLPTSLALVYLGRSTVIHKAHI